MDGPKAMPLKFNLPDSCQFPATDSANRRLCPEYLYLSLAPPLFLSLSLHSHCFISVLRKTKSFFTASTTGIDKISLENNEVSMIYTSYHRYLFLKDVQPHWTTLFGVSFPRPTPQGRWAQRHSGRYLRLISRAARGNPQDTEAIMANLLRKECLGWPEGQTSQVQSSGHLSPPSLGFG